MFCGSFAEETEKNEKSVDFFERSEYNYYGVCLCGEHGRAGYEEKMKGEEENYEKMDCGTFDRSDDFFACSLRLCRDQGGRNRD